jgi:hypothetical protein
MSKIPSFLIIADRGRLLSYRVDHTGRSCTPRLVESLELIERRQQLREFVTDRMGAFPNGGSFGQGNSPGERMALVEELSLRTIRNIAGRMTEFLDKHAPQAWGFAAPSSINSTILNEIPDRWRKRLSHNLPLDLTKTPADELLEHFED